MCKRCKVPCTVILLFKFKKLLLTSSVVSSPIVRLPVPWVSIVTCRLGLHRLVCLMHECHVLVSVSNANVSAKWRVAVKSVSQLETQRWNWTLTLWSRCSCKVGRYFQALLHRSALWRRYCINPFPRVRCVLRNVTG